MTSDVAMGTRILLKARPTAPQLADRLSDPVPDGLELYLDRLDLSGDGWLERIQRQVEQAGAPADFTWLVEAPIRTLAGAYFDLTAHDHDHRETLRRVIEVGAAIGAKAANVHAVAPTIDAGHLMAVDRARTLAATFPLLEFYVNSCSQAGLIPQVENIPPVGRMRESAFVFSPIGTAPDDLLSMADAHPSLRFTVDLSHAALALHWQTAELDDVAETMRPVALHCRRWATAANLSEWLAIVAHLTTTVHVSNASGLLGEGLAYSAGDEDLDAALRPLLGKVPYFVTETLEANPDHAAGMREVQTRLMALRDGREEEER